MTDSPADFTYMDQKSFQNNFKTVEVHYYDYSVMVSLDGLNYMQRRGSLVGVSRRIQEASLG